MTLVEAPVLATGEVEIDANQILAMQAELKEAEDKNINDLDDDEF